MRIIIESMIYENFFLFFLYSKLGLDLIPRVGPLAVNPTEVGIVSLHNFHSSSDENTKNTSVSFYDKKREFDDYFFQTKIESWYIEA